MENTHIYRRGQLDTSIDYSQYSLAELKQARHDIDESAYPERVKQLDALILEKQAADIDLESKPTSFVRTDKAKFHGEGKEFFSIWIVNMLLTVLTLGIYSAWAKVRTNRYFFSNTDIDGHRFSYLAEPLQILKGRIIAVILFGGYYLSASLSPAVFGFLTILFLFIAPFIIVQSMRFNMRMTSYRNVRFNFKGGYWAAFRYFVLYPVLTVFTAYLALPWAMKKMDNFILENTRWGDTEFKPELDTTEYYTASFGAGMLSIFVGGVMFFALGMDFEAMADPNQTADFTLTSLLLPVTYLVVFLVYSSFYQSHIRNHLFNSTYLVGTATFKSEMKFLELMWIRGSNFLAILCTLGLAMPWTRVRTSKYMASVTTVSVTSKIDSTEAGEQNSATAITDEVAGAFDLDVSLG